MNQAGEIEHCDLQCHTNNTDHHTELNGVDRLLVRRGQPFSLTLQLRPGSQLPSSCTLTAHTGPLPREESGTKVSFGLSDFTVNTAWSASITSPPGDPVSLSICSSPDAPIGLYSLSLDLGHSVPLGQFILLFNPWCARDAVYMSSEEKRQEYVLAQDGLVYKGSSTRIKAYPWLFGQFETGILDICLRILDENPKFVSDADKDCSARRNPVYVTRVISAMVNSQDDRGVLVGQWGGDYSDGVRPTRWTGSGAILRQWAERGSVRYGQCWVFASVACTVSRALGIPCRVVTNFGSAHDKNANLLIEFLYDEDGEDISAESVWNFHVWVDNWMVRADLSPEYSGWQASDPTPQEKSEDVYCCGPVPLKGLREGDLTVKYDAPFVFAEVNADVVEYVRLTDGRMARMGGSTANVGHHISTKAVGSDERHDITHQYKYSEGSEEERRVFQKAKHHNKLLQKGEEPGLHVKIKLPPNMLVGGDYDVSARVVNNQMEDKTCRFLFTARTVSYDGKLGAICGHAYESNLKVLSGEEKSVVLRLEYSVYGENLTSDKQILLKAIVIDQAGMDFHKTQKTVVLDNPDINIRILGEPRVGQLLSAEVSLQNPLPEALQNCCFSLEGAGLTGAHTITHMVGTVGPQQEAKVKVDFIPTNVGLHKLLVDFDSDKLSNVKGFLNIDVKE
ncbi:protein-glutamine gamma-glutamyltransferase 2a isoform X1 [Osmerus mordax]|uniref:protein-glutamine gamma-glutamyltransferase 2a isoform X1 n=1 Tax=Osmerus mordax TaxID=8014 RepID=UPI0035109BD6